MKSVLHLICESTDSKACAVYTITVRDGMWHPDLKWVVADTMLNFLGGHNGVYFDGDVPSDAYLDPDWGEIPDDFLG